MKREMKKSKLEESLRRLDQDEKVEVWGKRKFLDLLKIDWWLISSSQRKGGER